jgi:hypothetical protein
MPSTIIGIGYAKHTSQFLFSLSKCGFGPPEDFPRNFPDLVIPVELLESEKRHPVTLAGLGCRRARIVVAGQRHARGC